MIDIMSWSVASYVEPPFDGFVSADFSSLRSCVDDDCLRSLHY